jgi:hypothetical protein
MKTKNVCSLCHICFMFHSKVNKICVRFKSISSAALLIDSYYTKYDSQKIDVPCVADSSFLKS